MSKKRTKPERNTKSKSRKHTTVTLKKWNTVEDIPMDAEDEFHAARDKILLEHEQNGGYYSDDGDEDEVFALKGMQDDSENEKELDDHLDQEYYEIEEEEEAPSRKKTKKENKSKKVNGKLITQNKDKSDEEEDDAEESWGQGKSAYYSSNADQLDSDDEEGHELEEQEATRLQMKGRQELRNEDFGLNDELEYEKRPEVDDILDPLPEAIPLSMDKQSLLRHLEKTNPEALALAKDWEDVAHQLHRTRLKIEKLEEEKAEPLGVGMIHLHYQTLLSYSTVLAFYLHMRASAKYTQRPALLQSHPIMQRLLTLKQGLQILEDLDFAATETEDGEDEYMDMDGILSDGEQVWRLSEAGNLEPHELDDLLQDAESQVLPEPKAEKPRKKKRKVVVEDAKEHLTNSIFDLVEPEFVSSNTLSSHRHNNRASDDLLDNYGDPMSLTAVDAVDKSARRKKLRFHTSKIESASSRRRGARNQMAGGDDDIPYRERKKDRDARLVKEAANRAGNERGEDLTLDSGDEEEGEKHGVGEKRKRLDDEEDDYYELVKMKSKEAKARQKAEYDEAHGLPRVHFEEESSGPRSLTRAILKNKGLTPQRPKAVRNPRVKKRQRFEKAKRKVSSQKAVFRGGLSETKGRYEGEKSGISKVVKSVRLG